MNKPNLHKDVIEGIIKKYEVDREAYPVVMVGIRGYELGAKKNKRGVYDDALFICSPTSFLAVNGNTDPSRYRKGRGKGSQKGMASLNLGMWWYKTGIHNGSNPHPAFRQAGEVIVTRDGIDGNYEDRGMFGINIHRGGNNGTSSLGCQTVIPAQWDLFKATGYAELSRYKQKLFPYILDEV